MTEIQATRLGGAAIGLLTGMVLGLVVAYLLFMFIQLDVIAWMVFGTAAVGGVAGYISLSYAEGLVASTLHFLHGLVAIATKTWSSHSHSGSWWLYGVFLVGLCCAIALYFVW